MSKIVSKYHIIIVVVVIIIMIIIIIIIIIIRKYRVDVQWGIVSSYGERDPSRDGVSIKILVCRHLKPNP